MNKSIHRKAMTKVVTLAVGLAKNLSPSERAFQKIWTSIENIEGFLVSPDQERWLFKTAKALPNGAVIVEIGSYKGRSTCCLAYGCRGSRKCVFAIDTFEGNEVDFYRRGFLNEFNYNLESRSLSSYVTPIKSISTEAARLWNKPISLLFIDGSHQYEDVLADFDAFFPHIVPGGIVALHDVVETWPGVLKAWENVIKHKLDNIGTCSTIAYGTKPFKEQ